MSNQVEYDPHPSSLVHQPTIQSEGDEAVEGAKRARGKSGQCSQPQSSDGGSASSNTSYVTDTGTPVAKRGKWRAGQRNEVTISDKPNEVEAAQLAHDVEGNEVVDEPGEESSDKRLNSIVETLQILSEVPMGENVAGTGTLRLLIAVGEDGTKRQLVQVLMNGPHAVLAKGFRSFLNAFRERLKRQSQSHAPSTDFRTDSLISVKKVEARLLNDLVDDERFNVPLMYPFQACLSAENLVKAVQENFIISGDDNDGTELVIPLPVVCNIGNVPGSFALALRQCQPDVVVLYDLDLVSVREIEVYCAEAKQLSARQIELLELTPVPVFTGGVKNEIHSPLNRCQDEAPLSPEVIPVDNPAWLRDPVTACHYCFLKSAIEGPDVRVTLVTLHGSSDQHKFVSSLKGEKRAWDQLIHQKEHLVVGSIDELSTGDERMLAMAAESFPSALVDRRLAAIRGEGEGLVSGDTTFGGSDQLSSRQGGGGSARLRQLVSRMVKQSVVIDVREFRSSLPYQLYCAGMEVMPVTLVVGDYVMSREVCLERKSLSDLIQSMSSGRLYHQAESMRRYYTTPMLLVEFEHGKPFVLQQRSSLGSEISSSNIMSKLVILVRHFPQLRLIWSPNSHFTATVFIDLKEGREQPNLEQAVRAGANPTDEEQKIDESGHLNTHSNTLTPSPPTVSVGASPVDTPSSSSLTSEGGSASSRDPSKFTVEMSTNRTAVDVLRKLPGVTSNNVHTIIRRVSCLKQLCTMSVDELEPIIGRSNAESLRAFLTATPSLDSKARE
eukprot:GHVN01082228.1.p1 GENE.GHVN01082228.1~~GHVN01082228.1.p1  ORF type:complete len:780 (+),score=138.21 GHVN01082228.1:1524-3863(+)